MSSYEFPPVLAWWPRWPPIHALYPAGAEGAECRGFPTGILCRLTRRNCPPGSRKAPWRWMGSCPKADWRQRRRQDRPLLRGHRLDSRRRPPPVQVRGTLLPLGANPFPAPITPGSGAPPATPSLAPRRHRTGQRPGQRQLQEGGQHGQGAPDGTESWPSPAPSRTPSRAGNGRPAAAIRL